VPLQVTAIMIGVEDLARSKKFYGEGLGCEIEQDYPKFVSFNLGDESSSLALYEREAEPGMPASPRRDRGSGESRFTSSSRRGKRWTRS
jgi:catechol 2,3-dioxygenase-like lactoylglutathione lyase family enzyme